MHCRKASYQINNFSSCPRNYNTSTHPTAVVVSLPTCLQTLGNYLPGDSETWKRVMRREINVFADKSAFSIQTTGNCRNLLATKATTRRFLAQHPIPLCDQFPLATASNHLPTSPATIYQPVYYKIYYFSSATCGNHGVTDQSLGLRYWGLSNRFYSDCQKSPATTPQLVGRCTFFLMD